MTEPLPICRFCNLPIQDGQARVADTGLFHPECLEQLDKRAARDAVAPRATAVADELQEHLTIFTHEQIWAAIELVARRKQWSLSGLATRAGLDPTALNRSKRGVKGKPHWPSTGTIAKILSAAEMPFCEFVLLVESASPHPHGSQRNEVLLVDDEAEFCALVAQMLRQAGYGVRMANHHIEALEIIDSAAKLDLLCTDIVMPEGLGGLALAKRALSKRPQLKVIYMTGYDVPGLRDDGVAGLVRKPFPENRLLDEVSRVLKLA